MVLWRLQLLYHLNIIPASIVEDGKFNRTHFGGFYAEFYTQNFQSDVLCMKVDENVLFEAT